VFSVCVERNAWITAARDIEIRWKKREKLLASMSDHNKEDTIQCLQNPQSIDYVNGNEDEDINDCDMDQATITDFFVDEDIRDDGQLRMELFTDGSAIANCTPAGWGVFSLHCDQERKISKISESCGPVVLQTEFNLAEEDSDAESDTDDVSFASFSATRHTNNTGELFAFLHAIWLIRESPAAMYIIRFDSYYAAYMVTGVWKPKKENVLLIRKIHNLFMDTLQTHQVRFMHVAGHSTSFGNKMADKLANKGRQERKASHTTRLPDLQERMHSWASLCG
jgi:ribonuclease HI